ncbi:hypothetical protein H2198_000144 [Neophaeococcomyces mojaviensis]|uniref:Uncharacterized protein n=1 Tax=Neophaeococcomyces mojaviensis TaxID=3383035 RepID=A0ACC3AKZ9_9EURO|nr:hypothetical protein H2198_000144 [Knufia sp. JES_112]
MLLLHQTGAVRVGEVVRYTLTYTPSLDRILPPPPQLHVRIKNSSAIPLRAAYLHGPYTLYVSCYPSTFDPNKKFESTKEEGDPEYEPQLKAGGQWTSKLKVPESVRRGAGLGELKEHEERKCFTWIIEIASQVLFSTTAAVHYELLVGRDEKSVSLGFTGVVSSSGAPGRLEDHQQGWSRSGVQPKGVFTKAVKLRVDDTASLWNTPAFPHDEETTGEKTEEDRKGDEERIGNEQRSRKKRKRIHLVLVTHGLHSNLGADMLFLKESIDATARQAREDAKRRKQDLREQKAKEKYDFGREAVNQRAKSAPDLVVAPTPTFQEDEQKEEPAKQEDDGDDDEQVIVRGFNGNAVRTEKGIQYLGKRLAKYVLSMTYPDQPYLPVKSTITQSITRTFTGTPKPTMQDGRHPSHKNSSIAKDEKHTHHHLPYKITSISFIGHSLGGLIQTYAIAYIQKHSPGFFDRIEPINFVALASPFLGLSNENPMYVKFALDFGLVGRTGQDLGLTWRAPTLARNGWGAVVSGFSSDNKQSKQPDPGAKPLLRILPTGPAHVALKRFRNRSVYSNVVNDGIVPLRTSCLLFLDWRGLGRVEKARRENGLVGTMVNWGLNEITGTNASTPRRGFFEDLFSDSGDEVKRAGKNSSDPGAAVPQAEAGSGLDRDSYDAGAERSPQNQLGRTRSKSLDHSDGTGIWSTFTNFFRPQAGTQKTAMPKQQRIYRRGQTLDMEGEARSSEEPETKESSSLDDHRKLLVRGSSLYTNSSDNDNLDAPPRTTVFESAGDLLNPPLPPKEFLLDPEARPRTIFHDRVYHPEDIPPPPTKRQRTFMRSRPNVADITVPGQAQDDMQRFSSAGPNEQGGMRIEEKIARAYHKDMAWRKVLVRLEPDAHNNIIVRRMFANAYGWPVVKHMCDTHFGYTAAAKTRDEDESPIERAQPQEITVGKEGEEVADQTKAPDEQKIQDEKKHAATTDHIPDKQDHEVDTLHMRQKNIKAAQPNRPANQKEKAETASRSARTASELRESRDQVPDLISMVSAQGEPSHSYSSMHSGTAALHSLARKDSARWSDRFFESSEEEDDTEDEGDLNTELQKAYDRGVIHDRYNSSPQSTRSGKSSKRTKAKPSTRLANEVFSEAGEPSVVFDEPEEMSHGGSQHASVVNTIPDPQTLSLSGLGLGREVRNISTVNSAVVEGEAGITEQVARARTKSGGEHGS